MSLDITDRDLPRLLPETLEYTVRGWVARSAGALLVLAALIGWLCLLTWSIADPSYSRAADLAPRNLLGPLGAIVADLALQTLGLVSIVALFGPIVWGVELITAGRMPSLRAKLILFPVAVLLIAGGSSGLPSLPGWLLANGSGGLIGDLLFSLCATVFATVNAERADALGGLTLLAGGLGLLAHSLGFSVASLAGLEYVVPPPRRPAMRQHPAVRQQPIVRWPKISIPLKKSARVEPELPMGADIRLQPQQPSPSARREGFAGWSPSWTTAEAPKADETIPAEDDDPSSRGAAFDRETDEGVRAVAQRFAPKSGVAAAAPKVVELPTAPTKQRSRSGYSWPSTSLLRRQVADTGAEPIEAALKENARLLEEVLGDFGIKGEVKAIHPGPVVTLYEYEPARGIKSARIIGLADDIARSMSAIAVRVAVVPGRNAIGIEVPNAQRETVYLREIFDSETFRGSQAMLPIALGKSIAGEAIIADLARMPHLLVAGTTGSGKSVGVNSMILSLLFKLEPSRCRLLLIDPKMLELSVYNRIPHLLAPVVTDPAEAVAALNWAVREMEERYKRMSKLGVRNIEAFNARLMRASAHGERIERTVQTGFDAKTGAAVYEREPLELEPLPYIVVVVDEFADLMAVAGKEIEMAVQRLAQMARAAGIHLIMATQRPSVDVITGTIKANFPSRISFKVASKIDSRTILNEPGAEQLLGRGDMLYSNGSDQALRVHGAFVSDDEVETVVEALRQAGEPNYVPSFADPDARTADSAADTDEDDEALYARAVELVVRQRKASTTYLQRQLGIGYNRAAAIMERMEEEGVVGPAGNGGRREILVPAAA